MPGSPFAARPHPGDDVGKYKYSGNHSLETKERLAGITHMLLCLCKLTIITLNLGFGKLKQILFDCN